MDEPRAPRRRGVRRLAYARAPQARLASPPLRTCCCTRPDPLDEAIARGTSCTERQAQPPAALAGGHPPKRFYGPSEAPPAQDLAHVVGDCIVVVRYRPDLPERDIDALRRFATSGSRYVIAAPDRRQNAPVRAIAATRSLTCTKVDRMGLASFRDDRLASLRS